MGKFGIGPLAVCLTALCAVPAPCGDAAQAPPLPHDPEGVEICGVRLGVSTFDQVRQMLEQGVKDKKFADLSYYEGTYLRADGAWAFRPATEGDRDYDAQHLMKTVTGFWAYSEAFPRVPFQMFFFRGVVYKVDLGLKAGLIEDLKAALDRQYGKAVERSISPHYGTPLGWGLKWRDLPEPDLPEPLPQVQMVLHTGITSVGGRSEFYLYRVDDKMPHSFYCNFFDRALEGAYLEYEKTLEEHRKQEKK
jgi:hypothetical protein